MSYGLLAYFLIGLICMKMEHDTFDYEFENETGLGIFLTVAQQSIHYLRVVLTWPLYMIEDFIIFMDTYREGGEGLD